MSRSKTATLTRGSGLALLLVLAAACSATGGSGGGGNPDLITEEQITSLPDGTAFTVIQRFRSGWLRPRSQGTLSGGGPDFAQVYVDELHFGDINSLSRISSSSIESIQFISAIDATTRYGTGYAGGIIRINTHDR
ncbi:MAG TPA: hypothetical protein VM198_04100 [Longimicrobiales bacterium]|nr:hypothetical protein [Longimicrobiales bacterium]